EQLGLGPRGEGPDDPIDLVVDVLVHSGPQPLRGRTAFESTDPSSDAQRAFDAASQFLELHIGQVAARRELLRPSYAGKDKAICEPVADLDVAQASTQLLDCYVPHDADMDPTRSERRRAGEDSEFVRVPSLTQDGRERAARPRCHSE